MRLDLEYPTIIAASFDGVVVGVARSVQKLRLKKTSLDVLGGTETGMGGARSVEMYSERRLLLAWQHFKLTIDPEGVVQQDWCFVA